MVRNFKSLKVLKLIKKEKKIDAHITSKHKRSPIREFTLKEFAVIYFHTKE